jgi:3,4-dihydroxy 2-butanone 4-phosphate synthase/GTP cyclohydrolase II
MHALSIFADAFGEVCEESSYLARSMEMIAEEGAGVVVIINKPRSSTRQPLKRRSWSVARHV